MAILKYSVLISSPMLRSPQAEAAAVVDPEPMNGSRMTPSPSGSAARTSCRRKCCGLSDGCGAISRSRPRAGEEQIKSRNGSVAEIRRSPPVFYVQRLSCTRPSRGLRTGSLGRITGYGRIPVVVPSGVKRFDPSVHSGTPSGHSDMLIEKSSFTWS